MLIMTLPTLMQKALQLRYGDQSLRYAYPLASWTVEQSIDQAQRMVTLQTADGFSVCFAVPREQQDELAEALMMRSGPQAVVRAN